MPRRVLGYQPRILWPKSTAFLLGGAVLICLLGTQSHLSYLDLGPDVPIGWQAGEAAFRRQAVKPSTATNATSALSSEADWSMWPDTYDPLSNNPRPITEITLVSCTFPPSLLQNCEPSTTDAEDAVRGPWIRLDQDLNRRIGLWYLYIFYRRAMPRSTSLVLTNLTVLSPELAKSEPTKSRLVEEDWDMQPKNVHSGLWHAKKANIWTRSVPRDSPEATNALTEIDVVYGESTPRWGWEYITTISDIHDEVTVQLHGRRSLKGLPATPTLRFSEAGNFTALQLADLHFSVDGGDCRDIANETACPDGQADQATMGWLNSVIDDVNPDLVVLTGDQLNGQDTSWAASSVIYKVASLFRDRQTPWTVIFGNHDSETTDMTRSDQMSVYKSLPYFVGEHGPDDVDGVGNYVLPILSADQSNTTVFNMWFLDSHEGKQKWFSKESVYQPLTQKQIDWFNNRSLALQPILRPYKPADLSHEEDVFGISTRMKKTKRQNEDQSLRMPNAMAWIHIPLPEAYDRPDTYRNSDQPIEVGTTDLEGYSASKENNGFFSKAISTQREDYQPDALPQVKVLAHGHSHLRDACTRVREVYHCFSGGSSYAGYGMRGFDRRVRVYRLSDFGETISTWKLLDGSGRGDRQSGEFDVLKAEESSRASQSGHDDENESKEISEEQINQEWDAIVDELKDEEDRLKGSAEGDGLSELIDETEEEDKPATLVRRQKPSRDAESGAPSSRFASLDYMVLAGQGAPV